MFNLFTTLEIAINRALPLDPIAEQRVRTWHGKSISLLSTHPNIAATFHFLSGQVTVQQQYDPEASVKVEGVLHKIALLALTSDEQPVNEGVRISGEYTLLIELKEILHQLNIDWEEPLSRWIGDVAAQQIGHWSRQWFQWGKRATQTFLHNSDHFLTHEWEETIREGESQHFMRAVDQLYADSEKLMIKVRQLETALQDSK